MWVQAVDPVTGIWTKAVITTVQNEEVKITWPGFDSIYDCWFKKTDLRLPQEKRSLSKRHIGETCRDLCRGNVIKDIGRGKTFIVQVNDPFKGEVCKLFIK